VFKAGQGWSHGRERQRSAVSRLQVSREHVAGGSSVGGSSLLSVHRKKLCRKLDSTVSCNVCADHLAGGGLAEGLLRVGVQLHADVVRVRPLRRLLQVADVHAAGGATHNSVSAKVV